MPGTELAEQYGVTRQRIDQILKARGAIGAAEARGVRSERRTQEFDASVKDFIGRYGDDLRSLASAGATRVEVESKFAYLLPTVPADVVREAVKSSGTLFNVNREEYNFGQSVIEAGIWHVLARAKGLQGDLSTALSEISLEEMAEIAQALAALGVTTEHTREVFLSIAGARHQLTVDPDLTISKKQYDEQRGAAIEHLGLTGGQGSLAWPPTSQTVMKRLGSGYWTDALASVGITASIKGRSRGLLLFEEADYHSAIMDFLGHCLATGSPESFDAFEVWVAHEDRLGRQRPSGPAVRLYYQSWINAKRTVLTGSSAQILRLPATVAASAARTALHDASSSQRAELERLPKLPARDRAAALVAFVKDFMGVFEARRRTWFRAIVRSDSDAVTRRLAAQGLKPAQRIHLEAVPPDIDAVLTDMFLDRLLGSASGIRNTDSWLADEAQDELDSIRDVDLAAARVMRELRNYFTHDSAEAQGRLTETMRELAEFDDRFRTDRPMTRRFVCQWLLNDDATRLAVLSGSILAAWRAMLAAEAVAGG
ncbi:hypothetical protein OG474_29280 [Kribbella sp. NBC_01505]|uniref:hypothetical protein n=1 Tax=Kribbella sp. NBC_01505 TaxID=2903580 RepID=UPI0038700060